MLMNRQFQIAVSLLSLLTDTPQTVESLSLQLAVSYDWAQKVANKLRKHNLIGALRGNHGGLFKIKPVSAATLYKIFQRGKSPMNDTSKLANERISSQLEQVQF